MTDRELFAATFDSFIYVDSDGLTSNLPVRTHRILFSSGDQYVLKLITGAQPIIKLQYGNNIVDIPTNNIQNPTDEQIEILINESVFGGDTPQDCYI